MFEFKANIVKRRRFKKSYFLTGLIAAGLLGYSIISYFENGFIPLIETIIDQIGLNAYSMMTYLAFLSLLVLLMIPAFQTVFKKKSLVGGSVFFDEDNLEIKKGREHFIIPEKELSTIKFELKKLPSGDKKQKGKLFGGSYMKIPTTRGTFECELDINSQQDKDKLLEMIEFLKIEHDVKVKLEELK